MSREKFMEKYLQGKRKASFIIYVAISKLTNSVYEYKAKQIHSTDYWLLIMFERVI